MLSFLISSRARRRAQTRLWMLGLIVVLCGGGGLLAGRLLAKRPAPTAVALVATPAPPAPAKTVAPDPQPTVAATVLPIPVVAPSALPAPTPITSVPIQAPTATTRAVASAPGEIVTTYGKSVNGTALTAYILGDGPNVTLFFGAFHGNEPITDDMVKRLRAYLKSRPELLQGHRVILAPVVNPDGLSRGKRANAHGVDLNRNFPGTWQKQATKARYNPGPKPASEPETRAVIKLIETYNPSKIVSFHQPFHTLNYTGEPGLKLAQAMKKYNRYPITPDVGYPTPGSFGDYCGKTLKVAIVTYELPTQSADAAWKDNREAFVAAIRH